MLNLRTAMPIIKIFNATFYILVCNVKATLRCCKENTSKCVISVIAIAMLNKTKSFQPLLIKLENGSLSKHLIKDASFFYIFALYQIIKSCEYYIY